MKVKVRLPKTARYFLYTLLTCALCAGCNNNETIKINYKMKTGKDTLTQSNAVICGSPEPLKFITGSSNVAIGYEPLETPYVIDTTVYCNKCKTEHKISIGAYSKEVLYIANCGNEFSVSANARKRTVNGR